MIPNTCGRPRKSLDEKKPRFENLGSANWWRKRELGPPILLQLSNIIDDNFIEILQSYTGGVIRRDPPLLSGAPSAAPIHVEETPIPKNSVEEKELNAY